MYQIFSSENWTTLLYAAMAAEMGYTQTWIVAIFLCGWFLFANCELSVAALLRRLTRLSHCPADVHCSHQRGMMTLPLVVHVLNQLQNFAVAEEEKRKQQVEVFIRKTEPLAGRVSWVERLNPYRLMRGRHNAVKVDILPPSLVLPLKQSVGPEVGTSDISEKTGDRSAKGAMQRLLGRKDAEKTPLRRLERGRRSAIIEDLDDDMLDDRGL